MVLTDVDFSVLSTHGEHMYPSSLLSLPTALGVGWRPDQFTVLVAAGWSVNTAHLAADWALPGD